jgi:hypothetical protein
MADETFAVNLMRAIVAELHVLNLQNASREMLGRSYFSLGIGDKMAVDQVVLALVGGNYTGVTPEWLAGPQPSQQPAGFGIPTPTPKPPQEKSVTRLIVGRPTFKARPAICCRCANMSGEERTTIPFLSFQHLAR